MQTDDHLENLTEYSDAVQVTVRDYTGRIRVFNLDHAKVILRYVNPTGSYERYAYHPSNLELTTGFRSGSSGWLELVIATENLVTLESE